ncbi:hypothetical protein HL658_04460 [Azospirillum sp. RWY-5-1]|uniref:DUF3006 domain-containing protein n=1 Tax=Azospirillum oleiclasticum TaxID=2735135 RepID=A0ABX2T6Q1_9PROT|nr:hypothetical protein [Azospirillum oleiclasticum]NYZ11792.1 hypothetical protein [Azospirillum oleiclasticum]NYZ18952.1 hypothetical protein [Azospirillum oleiclasticum]
MAHVLEIRGNAVVGNDDRDDTYLPPGTPIQRPDGHYVSFGMDVEGPYSRDEAEARLQRLKRATDEELGR